MKYVIFKHCGAWALTTYENYNAFIMNAFKVTHFRDFSDPLNIISYLIQYSGACRSDFMIME